MRHAGLPSRLASFGQAHGAEGPDPNTIQHASDEVNQKPTKLC
jgi:hypothetical protein